MSAKTRAAIGASRALPLLPASEGHPERVALAPGAIWLRHWLTLDTQQALAAECRTLMDGPISGYVPTVRGGGQMRVRMMCLGRHWNAMTYTYQAVRGDHDGQPVPPVPTAWRELAARLAADAGFGAGAPGDGPGFDPDICLINWYGGDGRMGLHQDKDESPASIATGRPVVSISLGDTARFLWGGMRRRDPIEPLLLESGDVFVFGGQDRLRYHGVARIVPASAPSELGLDGRFNLTFREY